MRTATGLSQVAKWQASRSAGSGANTGMHTRPLTAPGTECDSWLGSHPTTNAALLPNSRDLATWREAALRRTLALVRRCFESSAYCRIRMLDCELNHGAIVIRGTVPSYYLKQVAQELVRRLGIAAPISFHDVKVCSDARQ